MSESDFEGGCLCGEIRYRATTAPTRVVSCHCAMCRRHSGAAFLTFVHFPAKSFKWIGREPSRYRSSKYASRGFCPSCGSTVTMHEEVLNDRIQVSLGSLDAPERVRPDDHVWTQSQLPWLELIDDAPRFPRCSTAVPSKAEDPD